MNIKQQIESAANKYLVWHKQNKSTRLTRHEALKAIMFWQFYPNALPEQKIDYEPSRNGFVDIAMPGAVIEIDDGPNAKSLSKLAWCKENGYPEVFWILLLSQGRGGKATRMAEAMQIPTLRIFARNNAAWFEWAVLPQNTEQPKHEERDNSHNVDNPPGKC